MCGHTDGLVNNIIIGLLPDTSNCGLRMRRECRERFLRHQLQRKSVKKVYCELKNLNSHGFTNWATDALKLVNDLDLDITEDSKTFTNNCKQIVRTILC